MEFWLSKGSKKLRLPIPPSSFTISKGNNNIVVDVNGLGEVGILGKGRLSNISLDTFFPRNNYSFCQYSNFLPPYENIKIIDEWRVSNEPIRLLITETDINLLCMVDEFGYGERDGTGDVYFNLVLKEYRDIKVVKVKKEEIQRYSDYSSKERRVTKEKPKTYKVVKGDTLWDLSKKFYGDHYKWRELAKRNGVNDPKLLQIGKELIL